MLSRLRSLFGRENREHPEARDRQKEAAVRSQNKTGTNKWTWHSHRAGTESSSQPPFLTEKQVKEEMERVSKELQLMTNHRNELPDRLLFSEGTVDNRPYHKPCAFCEKVKFEYKVVLWELNIFENNKTDTSEEFHEITKEIVFYRGLHSRLLIEATQLKRKVDKLRQENKKLQEEWGLLKQHLENLNLIHTNQEEKSDQKIQQQQELKRLEERLEDLLKQKEMVIQIREMSEKLQHHFDVSQMSSTQL